MPPPGRLISRQKGNDMKRDADQNRKKLEKEVRELREKYDELFNKHDALLWNLLEILEEAWELLGDDRYKMRERRDTDERV